MRISDWSSDVCSSDLIKPVIIAGAGPVGRTAARLLQEQGIPFLVLEADTRLADDLRASTFHPPSLDMLDRLGAAQPLIAQGLITPTWQIRIHPGGERVVFELGRASCRESVCKYV